MINQQRLDFFGFQEGFEGYFKESLAMRFIAIQPRDWFVFIRSEELTCLISFLCQEPLSQRNVATLNFTIKNIRKQHLNSFLLALSNSSPPVRTSDRKSDSVSQKDLICVKEEFQK